MKERTFRKFVRHVLDVAIAAQIPIPADRALFLAKCRAVRRASGKALRLQNAARSEPSAGVVLGGS